MGGLASLFQMLITWGKRNPNGRLFTYVQDISGASRQLENLITHDHGLVGVLRAADIVNRRGDVSLRSMANELARARIENMESGVEGAQRGPKVFFLCVDQSTKAFLPALYYQTSKPEKDVKGVQDFRILAAQMLSKTATFLQSSKPLPDVVATQLGIILRELFENTHFWARTECDGKRIKRSLRGLRFELHSGSIKDLLPHVEDSQVLAEYLVHRDFIREDERLRIVEVSIFDSGPGLAQRILQRSINPAEALESEYEAVMRCLRLRSTSSLDAHRGIGLHTVLTMLSRVKGFLRLRTGRLSLYRDFVKEPYNASESRQEPFLTDWVTNKSVITERPRVEGTLLTMLIPVDFR